MSRSYMSSPPWNLHGDSGTALLLYRNIREYSFGLKHLFSLLSIITAELKSCVDHCGKYCPGWKKLTFS
jgi:hypothetical protein